MSWRALQHPAGSSALPRSPACAKPSPYSAYPLPGRCAPANWIPWHQSLILQCRPLPCPRAAPAPRSLLNQTLRGLLSSRGELMNDDEINKMMALAADEGGKVWYEDYAQRLANDGRPI